MLTTPATRTTALDARGGPAAHDGAAVRDGAARRDGHDDAGDDPHGSPVAHHGRRRRHGAGMPFDRQELERSGWRTTLDYRENHVRRRDGRLDHLEVVWRAEAERMLDDGSTLVVAASAHSAAKAWAALRREADLAAVRASSHDPSQQRSDERPEWSITGRRRRRGERTRRHATH